LNFSTKSSDGSSPTKQFQPKETIIYIRLVRWAMEALDVYTLNTSPTPPPRAQPQQALHHGILRLPSVSGSVADPGCLFHKIENYFSFEVLKKKIWANFQRIIELFTQKIVTKLSKIWVWDPGSGKKPSRIPIQRSKRHRIPDPDPQHWFLGSFPDPDPVIYDQNLKNYR
jgi:hypothetical protein